MVTVSSESEEENDSGSSESEEEELDLDEDGRVVYGGHVDLSTRVFETALTQSTALLADCEATFTARARATATASRLGARSG